ncbi:unnamed protein product [Clonostachys byssicola]|uniref:Zn(2)-C6 fungal-type domain-containing protein n=1 Tax=Clonostachys byssicola TaxID=160290 RepID=A0A9N9UI28_9HYPO|nr:unnamed protein product [Clonostachys byssicola]
MSTQSQPSPSSTATGIKRRRPALACEQCRARKIRCDRTHPCAACQRSRNQHCTYAPDPQPRKKVTLLSPSIRSGTVSPLQAAGSGHGDDPTSAPRLCKLDNPKSFTASGPSPALAGPLSQSNAMSSAAQQTNTFIPGVVALTPESLPGNATYANVASLESRISQLEQELAKSRQLYGGDLCNQLQTCKSLARQVKASRVLDFAITSMSFGKRMPTRQIADQLVEAYFRTFETVYRTVHVPTFRAEYEKYWATPQVADGSFVILLQLCMAIGAAFQDDTFSLRSSACHWVWEANLWLTLACKRHKISITGMQILCLLHHANDITNMSSDLSWIGAGTLLHTATHIGLHKDPKSFPGMTVSEAEIRRRLWATVIEIVLQASLDSGGAPTLTLEDYDADPPANVNDEQLVNHTNPASGKDDAELCTEMAAQLALLETWPARLAVAKAVNSIRSTASFNESLAINSDLGTSVQRITQRLGKFHEAGGISSFQLRYVEFTMHRFFLTLHLPLLPQALQNPLFHFSRKMSTDASTRLAAITYLTPESRAFLATRGTLSDWDFSRLFLCGSGPYRATQPQLILTLAVDLAQSLEKEPRSHYGALTAGMAEARSILQSWHELRRERLRAGDTNVKAFVSTACMLAHLNALEARCSKPEHDKMLREAAIKAVAECIEILQGMAGENSSETGETGEAGEAGDAGEAGPTLDTCQTVDLDDFGVFDFLGGGGWDDDDAVSSDLCCPVWRAQLT